MAKKQKHRGHFCKICGEIKANEKFSGKGHAAHICKTCASLPLNHRNELGLKRRVAHIDNKLRLTMGEWGFLEKYSQSKTYPGLRAYAAGVLAHKREMWKLGRPALEISAYSDLADDLKEEIGELFHDDLVFFMEETGSAPGERQLKKMAADVLAVYVTHNHLRITPDDNWREKCRKILEEVVSDMEDEVFVDSNSVELPRSGMK